MKRGMLIAGLCAGMWLGGSAWGQETIVTNLLVNGTLRQDANSEASGDFSAALGFESVASGPFSHAEGEVTTASGVASHAEGGGTIAAGDNSHAEGQLTEAMADNSHAGGAYSRVRAEDTNAFIHATGTSTNAMKETQFPNAAHFDRLVTLAPAVDAGNAVLSRTENDQRYMQSGTAITVSAVRVLGNECTAYGATIAGGIGNQATANNAMVGAGSNNRAINVGSYVGAGINNYAGGWGAFIGAGHENNATGLTAAVVGGRNNVVTGDYSFIGGGQINRANANSAVVAGGACNQALGAASFIGGGAYNIASSNVAAIAGGDHNTVAGSAGFIGGGVQNTVSGNCGVVMGGLSNCVLSDYGLAGGYGAQALHDGSWVWADAHAEPFASIASNEFAIRAAGGLRLEGRNSVGYDPEIGTNQYALWVRNFGATPGDARGLLVTTPEYNGGAGILFHAASMAGSSMASRFIVGADGNVGVGVNDPQNRLHVAGDARVSGDLLMMDGQNIFSPNFNPGTWGSGYDAWGPNAYLKYGFVRELLVAQNSDFLGKVKIGTSSDYATLNVGAPTGLVAATYAARFESTLGADSDKARGVLINFPQTTNGNSILFHAMSGAGPYTNSRFVVKADGKVGIGTSYPEATLHVAGDLRLDGTVIGDGSGLTNLPVTGLTTNEADARYATVAQGALADTALQPGTAITVAAVHLHGNTNTAPGSVVAGGSNNLAGVNSFVGSGQYNHGNADYSVVAGGYSNLAYAPYSAILGGQYNRASGTCSVVVGGYNNSILSNSYSQYSSIVGGNGNSIQRGSYSFVGGGYGNVVNYTGPSYGGAFIGGGYSNRVAGRYSVIPGGYANVASGLYSFAAGSFANAGHQSAFVWSDSSSGNPFSSTQPNQFLIRATGGVGINTNGTWGKALTVAGDIEVAGTGRFTVGLLVPQQGDISMGSYTNGTF